MPERTIKNNKVELTGEIVSDFTFSHEVFGENFYTTKISIKRRSDTVDILPIAVSDRLVDVKMDRKGKQIKIKGQLRSYNQHNENGKRLILSVFAREFEALEELPFMDDENHIFLDGYVCKQPNYRKTPLGREVTDILLAVNRPYGKSDYIPCIIWGRNARYSSSFAVGTHIQIEGRIQSREYQKKISDTEVETRIAYEVSASKITVVEETEDNADEGRD